MAFFGLTQMGPQNVFKYTAQDVIDISIFTEKDFEAAWKRCDKDGSGSLDISELENMLEIVYHGPAPPSEVRRVMTYFDSNSDGKVTWKEFKDNLKRLQEEGKPSFKESKEHERASDLHETIRKHESKDPSEKLAIPLTTQQDIGWGKPQRDPRDPYRPKIASSETKYADSMLRQGVYY